ncbi:MAG: selenide, water dikinase SelD [Bacteroidetes bacterium]|nr:selenide, water dikinase SelD [Bacteroidota bacterium]
MKTSFDLLTTVEQGGCSAKLPAQLLYSILKDIPAFVSENLIVGNETHDDAFVWKLDEETALVQTTDFFPPVCSDAYEFGQIAAANALSDIYAMGGRAITAMNLVMFPSSRIDISVLKEILMGGADKVKEAGAVLAGGHTIDDYPPKYGLSVTGIIHPEKIITNNRAKEGEMLILTKPIGTGVIIAGKRINEVSESDYRSALNEMKLLNKNAAEIMQKHNIRCATDVTGFSLLGHAMEMAEAGNVTLVINANDVPLLNRAYDLIDMGCIPGASFRNLAYLNDKIAYGSKLDYNLKMLLFDAQTSGGILMTCGKNVADKIIADLKKTEYPYATLIGKVIKKQDKSIIIS